MGLFRPEYIFRPSQIFRRLRYSCLKDPKCSAKTPWGLTLEFDSAEVHGRALLTHGLSDLRTCEAISKIVRPGDLCVDVGANIGIMTSLMAIRAGVNGVVLAFEPHPNTRKILKSNVVNWPLEAEVACVQVLPQAVSNKSGIGHLVEPTGFHKNSGIASLSCDTESSTQSKSICVDLVQLDDYFTGGKHVRVIKIDVEGHEDAVLEGARDLLNSGRIDFIIFEEFRSLPSPACKILESHGYHAYLLDRNTFNLSLIPVERCPNQLPRESTNIIASRDKEQIDFLMRFGWTSLR